MEPDFVKTDLIFMTLAGSHLYGTSTPESDIDQRGVCVPPKSVVMGFARNFEQYDVPGEDTIVYSLKKFMELATACNPNILELLFAHESCIQHLHPTWKELLKHRDKFLSAEAYHRFGGYAISQLKRIRSHRDWLLNPPTHKPTRAEFGLTESGAGVGQMVKGIDLVELDPQAMQIVERERRYQAAKGKWDQYDNWKNTRNPKRAKLEATAHYDAKNAMHLIRLLRMCEEILTMGNLTTRRPDAAELLEIRNGKYSYDELMVVVDQHEAKLKDIYENKKYVVPTKANRNELSDLCVELHEYHWKNKGK